MDTVILGTSGNDTIPAGGASTGNGALILTVDSTIAQGERATFDVLVNGVVVRSGISVTADHAEGDTQQVYVPMPAGTIDNLSIHYTNDPQTDYSTQDRNLFIESAKLNGTTLPVASAVYARDGFTGADNTEQGHIIQGRIDMNWGGTMTWSGSLTQNATPGAGGGVLIDGGTGLDTVTFAGARSGYTISHPAAGFVVTQTAGGATTTLGSVERLSFGDGTKVAIDMNGNGEVAAELVGALLGTSFLSNKAIVGTALSYLDSGVSAETLAGAAVETSGFYALAGGSSNADFVRFVYHNVVGYDPSPADLNTIVGFITSGAQTKASLAVIASELDLNEVHLVGAGVFSGGIEYT